MKLNQYKGLKAVKKAQKISDAHVMQELENIRQQRTQVIEITDRPAQTGDEVIIDYAGFVGDFQFPGGTAEMQPLTLGSGMFIPGFEEQLVGANVGDKVDVNVTFPEQYHSADLAGKEAVFHCTVHAIQTKDRDELLKELVKHVEDVTFDEAEVKMEIDIAVEGFARQLEQRGMNLEGYLQACGRTREEMDAELRPQAEDTIKARMALNEVCRLEGITVTQEEVDQAYTEVANMYRVSVQEVKDAYGADNDEKLRKDVLLKKAIAVLEANAEITEE